MLLISVCAMAQTWSFSGVVLNKRTGEPVEYATIILESTAQWAVADAEGKFSIGKIQEGVNVISISCLGFVTDTKEINISRNIENYKVMLAEDNLALEGATVTAQEKDNTATTSRMIDKTALDQRVAQIKKQIEETKSDFDREKLQERLAKLAGGVAVIRVGAATETEMKEAKFRMEDALNATRAAVEEGIIFGGGSAYIHASKEVEKVVAGLDGDEKTGAQIVLKALESPLFQIAENAGLNGAVIVNKVKESEVGIGFDAYKEEYVNMIDGGILDPAKVTRSALQNATSVASSFLTTEAAVANIKEPMPAMPAGAPGMM